MQVHCISISEHIWVGGCGPRGVGELPAGGICASQGTFSSCSLNNTIDTCLLQVVVSFSPRFSGRISNVHKIIL